MDVFSAHLWAAPIWAPPGDDIACWTVALLLGGRLIWEIPMMLLTQWEEIFVVSQKPISYPLCGIEYVQTHTFDVLWSVTWQSFRRINFKSAIVFWAEDTKKDQSFGPIRYYSVAPKAD